MPSLFDWSSTASSNTSVDGININTGMSPGNVDNALRSIMALLRSTFSAGLQNFLAGLSGLGIANGGTGAADAPTALANLGGLGSAYRDLQPVTKPSAFTFADAERGRGIEYTGAAAAATINPNSTTPITNGAVYVIRNSGSGVLTVTRGSGVSLKVNGSATSANAAIAVDAVGSLIRWGVDDWTITGSGVS